ncbi:unnamed protein product [Closterium sp. NIES-65]|nr:unnamed protein product [Closterium sp. NIES-65]
MAIRLQSFRHLSSLLLFITASAATASPLISHQFSHPSPTSADRHSTIVSHSNEQYNGRRRLVLPSHLARPHSTDDTELPCGDAWQHNYTAFHTSARAAARDPSARAQEKAELRYLTFTCTPGLCGGIGDLLIGLVSSFLLCVLQDRILIVDYPWMLHAFEPNHIDWRLGDDVPMDPARPFPPGPRDRRRRGQADPNEVQEGEVLRVNLHNRDLPSNVTEFFERMRAARNIRLMWNRGLLVRLYEEDGAWWHELHRRGLRLPSAFGCILRYLIMPTPGVRHMVREGIAQLTYPGTASICIHVRTSDISTWEQPKVGEKVKPRKENVKRLLKGSQRLFSCAQVGGHSSSRALCCRAWHHPCVTVNCMWWRMQKLEDYWYSSDAPGMAVKWVLMSSSLGLKQAAQRKYGNRFTDLYDLGQKLGSGQFGTTYVCRERSTGNKYACKSIPKSKLLTENDVEDVRREVAILYHVQGQPNIVNMKGAYEDRDYVHIVMELCTGGELYDTIIERIEARGVPYSEHDAAEMARVIVRVVERCHALGIVHRDLKPENFLLSSRDPDTAELKATDFGLSCFYKGEGMARHCGSPMYMAPEVVRWRSATQLMVKRPAKYGPEVDIWSAGVIIYALLCGFPPFYHSSHSTKEIFKAVLRANPSFSIPPWPSISDQAKDLLRQMLHPDPAKRPSAHEVLCHPWLAEAGVAQTEPLPPVVLTRLKQFTSMVKMKRMAMKVIAEGLKEEEIRGLRELFEAMDTDGSGTITMTELRDGLKKYGANLSDAEISRIMEETDIDQSGEIEYGEFLAATLNLSKIDKQENLLKAFAFFDTDGSGTITLDELQKACEQLKMSTAEVEAMMREVDENKVSRLAIGHSSHRTSARRIDCNPAFAPCASHAPFSAVAPSAIRTRPLRANQNSRRPHSRRLIVRATESDEGAIARRVEETQGGEASSRGAGDGATGETAGDSGGNGALSAGTGVNSADALVVADSARGESASSVSGEEAAAASSPGWWSGVWGAGGWQKRWSIVVLCFFAFLLCNMDRVNMSIAVLPMAEQFQWSPATVGLVQSSFFWGYLLTQVAGGVWADTIGGKQVLGFGVVWWSLATVLTPIAASLGLPALLFARACMGVGEGVAMPAMNNLLSKWVPVGERSRSLALVYSGMYLGSVAGLSLSPAIIHAFAWPSVFYSFGSLGLVWFACWQIKAFSSPAEDPSVSPAERALIAAGGAQKGQGAGKAHEGGGGPHLEGSEPLRLSTIPWRLLLSKAPVWAIIICHFCHNWGVFILLTWMPTYYHDVLGFNLTESGLFAVLPWLTMAIASNVGGWIADTLIARGLSVTLVRKVMQSIGFLGPAICLSLLSTVKSPVAAIALLMLSQGTDAFSQSGLYSNHQDIGPRYAGILLGLSNSAGVLAGVFGTYVTGQILQNGSWDEVFTVAVALYLVGTVVWNVFATGERRPSTLPAPLSPAPALPGVSLLPGTRTGAGGAVVPSSLPGGGGLLSLPGGAALGVGAEPIIGSEAGAEAGADPGAAAGSDAGAGAGAGPEGVAAAAGTGAGPEEEEGAGVGAAEGAEAGETEELGAAEGVGASVGADAGAVAVGAGAGEGTGADGCCDRVGGAPRASRSTRKTAGSAEPISAQWGDEEVSLRSCAEYE